MACEKAESSTKVAKEFSWLALIKSKGSFSKEETGEGGDLRKATGGHQSAGSPIGRKMTSKKRMQVSNPVMTPPCEGGTHPAIDLTQHRGKAALKACCLFEGEGDMDIRTWIKGEEEEHF